MGGGTQRGGAGLAVALLLAGCGPSPEDSEARRTTLAAEEARMDEALDAVEVRLLGNQARLHLWEELGRRHQLVSALQCRVAGEHMEGLARHLKEQEEKARRLRQRRRRVATADVEVLTSGRKPRQGNN